MAQVGHERHIGSYIGSEPTNVDSRLTDNEPQKTTRRNFLIGAASLGAVVGGVLVFRQGVGGEKTKEANVSDDASSSNTSSNSADVNISPNHSVSAVEAQSNIDQMVFTDFYSEDREWADPAQLVDLSREQLVEKPVMPITAENRTKEGFGKNFARTFEMIANAGMDKEDLYKARELGYPVGEKDTNGNFIGHYEDYVGENYIDPLLEGLFVKEYKGHDSTPPIKTLKEYILGFADDLEFAITDKSLLNSMTLGVELGYIETLPSSEFDRSLEINLVVTRPGFDMRPEDMVYDCRFVLNIDEGSDKNYIIELGEFGHTLRKG